jgi:membrane-associated phospholipid phosphatase
MAITVTATGNHYFIDSIAGAAAALAALTLVALYRRSRSSASCAGLRILSTSCRPSPPARNELAAA